MLPSILKRPAVNMMQRLSLYWIGKNNDSTDFNPYEDATNLLINYMLNIINGIMIA
jgi:hypothetical protein